MSKNATIKRASRLGLAAAALATATMLGASVAPAHAGLDDLCIPGPTPSIIPVDIVTYEDLGVEQMTVRLSRPACWQVTVHYATQGITATQAHDYKGTSGFVVFPPNSTIRTLPVTILDDPWVEQPEIVAVNSNAPFGATLPDKVGLMTILDGSPTPG